MSPDRPTLLVIRIEMPVLGICLGAQLLARALGAEIRAGEGPAIGFAPV